jgi:hypothetical protein
MLKPILAILTEGALLGTGLPLMYWVSGRSPTWQFILFSLALCMLGRFLVALPALRLESAMLQLLKASGPDGEKIREALDREQKKHSTLEFFLRPLGIVAFLCMLGLAIRFTK